MGRFGLIISIHDVLLNRLRTDITGCVLLSRVLRTYS